MKAVLSIASASSAALTLTVWGWSQLSGVKVRVRFLAGVPPPVASVRAALLVVIERVRLPTGRDFSTYWKVAVEVPSSAMMKSLFRRAATDSSTVTATELSTKPLPVRLIVAVSLAASLSAAGA